MPGEVRYPPLWMQAIASSSMTAGDMENLAPGQIWLFPVLQMTWQT